MAWLLHLFFEEFNVLSVFKSPMAIIGLDTLGFCNLSDSVRIRSSQGMLEATQRGVLCIMISKGEPSILGPNECVFDIEFATAVYHLDLGWTGLVSMGAMFFLPFLGTGSTGTPTVDSFCGVNGYNTFNKNIASFIGNPSRHKIPIKLIYQLKSFRSFR